MTRAVDGARPLRVLYFSNSLARGGAEEHLLLLVQGLDRSRFTVSLACPAELGRTLQADLPSDVELIPLRLRGPTDVWPALRLALVIVRRRIDILHSHLSFGSASEANGAISGLTGTFASTLMGEYMLPMRLFVAGGAGYGVLNNPNGPVVAARVGYYRRGR